MSRKLVDEEAVREARKLGLKWSKISILTGITPRGLRAWKARTGFEDPLREVSDEELATILGGPEWDCDLYASYLGNNKIGEKTIKGHLRSLGVRATRARIRGAVRFLQPDMRPGRWHPRVVRGVYHVERAMMIAHIDGWEKLKEWNWYVFALVDGKTRYILMMDIAVGKYAAGAALALKKSAKKHGLAEAIRADAGKEFYACRAIMHSLRGPTSYKIGKSTSNTRVERMWREKREKEMQPIIELMRSFVDRGVDPSNPKTRFIFQHVFTSMIQVQTRLTHAAVQEILITVSSILHIIISRTGTP